MATFWANAAKRISDLMRKDIIEIYVSEPTQDSIGELSDDLQYLTTCKANVTTPPEYIEEETQGTVRTHYYEISIDSDVSLPGDKKIFIKLISSRQGTLDTMLEVSQISGGLLGQTLSAADEKN